MTQRISDARQNVGDDAVVAQLAQRGVAFVLSAHQAASLREAGVSDGVLRHLQGRADADAELAVRIQRGRYASPEYYGAAYWGHPYPGYAGGLHYYGEPGYHFLFGGHHGGRHGMHGGHAGGHRGGHHGGRH